MPGFVISSGAGLTRRTRIANDVGRLAADCSLHHCCRRHRAAAWRLHDARLHRRADYVGRLLGPIERGIYRLAGIDRAAEQEWYVYALALLALNSVGVVALYTLQRLQGCYPSTRSTSMRLNRCWH